MAAAKRRVYYQKNKERIAAYNKSRIAALNIYQKDRYRDLKRDPAKFGRKMMDASMRTSIWRAIKKNSRSWKSLVGYSLDELIAHLSARFKPGMTIANYGEWHIDHITPKSHFKYAASEDEQFKACWSLANLQPLWARENMSKGNRYVG